MNNKKFLQPEILHHMADSLKALGHPLRLKIFEALAEGEKPVGTLVQELTIPQAIVSQQLRIMRSGNVVLSRRQGTLMLYRLAHPGLLKLLQCLLSCQDHCLPAFPPVTAPASKGNERKRGNGEDWRNGEHRN